jgi:hypothetical protein
MEKLDSSPSAAEIKNIKSCSKQDNLWPAKYVRIEIDDFFNDSVEKFLKWFEINNYHGIFWLFTSNFDSDSFMFVRDERPHRFLYLGIESENITWLNGLESDAHIKCFPYPFNVDALYNSESPFGRDKRPMDACVLFYHKFRSANALKEIMFQSGSIYDWRLSSATNLDCNDTLK